MNPIKSGDVRCDDRGPLRCMAVAEGWVMVRRPRCNPFAMRLSEFENLAFGPCVVCGKPAFPGGSFPSLGGGRVCLGCDAKIKRSSSPTLARKMDAAMAAWDRMEDDL